MRYFKEGDAVIVRTWEDMAKEYKVAYNDFAIDVDDRLYFIVNMKIFSGEIAFITKIYADGKVDLEFYDEFINELSSQYLFCTGMLSHYDDDEFETVCERDLISFLTNKE